MSNLITEMVLLRDKTQQTMGLSNIELGRTGAPPLNLTSKPKETIQVRKVHLNFFRLSL